ncbi:MAG: hypothetical protein HQ521_13475 [Bacteroidetes bacterium]|nr:hypothetical protein [Bacteroidota bacterium]
MKKALLITILIAFAQLSFTQSLQSDFVAHIDSSGLYLQKASSNLIAGTVSVGISAACLYWASSTIKDDAESKGTFQYALAGSFAAIGMVSYIAYIVNLNKSGKHLHKAKISYQKQQKAHLSFQTNQNGVGLALKF